jgi:type I restriction enzyme S subunit
LEPAVVAALSARQTGSSYPAVRDKDVFEQLLAVPPLDEQRRIVAAIEEQFSRLDAADRLLLSAAARLPTLEAQIIDAAVEGWPRRGLGELLREPLRNGHSSKAVVGGPVRTLTLTAVTRREFTDDNTKLTAPEASKVEGLWLEAGDLLIERSNTPELVGTAAVYRGPDRWAIFPDLMIRVRTNDEILPDFLELALRSRDARRYFTSSAQGIAGTMPKIDQGLVARFRVPVPSVHEQEHILADVDQRLTVSAALRTAIQVSHRKAAALRRSILEIAFRGELVPQDPSDEPASGLLERIRDERANGPASRRRVRQTRAMRTS